MRPAGITDWIEVRCHVCNAVLFECSATETRGPIRIICRKHKSGKITVTLPLRGQQSEVRGQKSEVRSRR